MKLVLQVLLQGISDGALAVGTAHIQRHLVHALCLCGDLGTAQDEPDLRSIAVTDGHVPALCDHLGDVDGGLPGSLVLVFHRLVGLVLDQRIAANSDNGELLFCHVDHLIVRAMTAFCACRRFSASSKTTELGPSITSLVTSISRSAGSGCM